MTPRSCAATMSREYSSPLIRVCYHYTTGQMPPPGLEPGCRMGLTLGAYRRLSPPPVWNLAPVRAPLVTRSGAPGTCR